MNIKVPTIPDIKVTPVKVKPVTVNIPKIIIPDIKVNTVSYNGKNSYFGVMSKGEKAGYSDGYYGRPNLSDGKDTVNDDYWLGYSCGYVSGRTDRELGNPSTL